MISCFRWLIINQDANYSNSISIFEGQPGLKTIEKTGGMFFTGSYMVFFLESSSFIISYQIKASVFLVRDDAHMFLFIHLPIKPPTSLVPWVKFKKKVHYETWSLTHQLMLIGVVFDGVLHIYISRERRSKYMSNLNCFYNEFLMTVILMMFM